MKKAGEARVLAVVVAVKVELVGAKRRKFRRTSSQSLMNATSLNYFETYELDNLGTLTNVCSCCTC